MANFFKYLSLGFALFAFGCSENTTSVDRIAVKDSSEEAATSKPKQAESDAIPDIDIEKKKSEANPNVVQFNKGLAEFIEEARAVVRGIPITSEREVYDRRLETLQNTYTRIPEPPKNHPETTVQWRCARQITVNLKAGSLYLKLISDFLQLGDQASSEEVRQRYLDLGNEQRANLDELEKANQDGRVPNIQLSDIIRDS